MNLERLRPLERMTAYDTRALQWVVLRPGRTRLARLARLCSRFGDGPTYAVIGLLLFYAEPISGPLFFVQALAAFLLELPVYIVLKQLVRRRRPADLPDPLEALIRPSDRFSFPSGHTGAAFLMATLITIHYPVWALAAYPLALLIGFSRVVLGVHYPSDIVAGAILGASCAVLILPLTA